MLNVALVDDEIIALKELEYLLSTESGLKVVGKYTSPEKAIEEIKSLDLDAVFLDVSMPEMNGFMVAEEIKKVNKNIEIVFITAHDTFALKAFEINAKDYVLKPFSLDRIKATLDRLSERLDKKENAISIKNVKKIPIKNSDKLSLVDVDKIIYCVANEGHVNIVTDKDSFISDETLNNVEERLKEFNFIKCHRKYLVNLDLIENIISWVNGTYILKLKGTREEIPVSRNYGKTIKNIFKI